MKKILATILTITLFATAFLLVACKNANPEFQSGSRNGLEGSILDWAIIPDEGDVDETIALAVKMFDNANELYKKVEFCKYSTYGLIKAGATCERFLFNVKNGEEWYESEVQQSEGLAAIASPSFLTLKYGSLSAGKVVVMNTGKDISVNKETGVPSGKLDVAEVSEEELPNFHFSQEGAHVQTDFVIRVDTVKSATITHNDEEGFFTVTIELDVENEDAVRVPLADLRENSKNAKYTSCTEIIEIWDTGHYKFFNAIDKWTGTVFVKINAVIDYKTYFSYDKNDCDLKTYFGYDNLLSLLRA